MTSQQRTRLLYALGAFMLAALAVIVTAIDGPAAVAAVPECKTTLKPDTVRIVPGPQTMVYSFSQERSALEQVLPDEGSGLRVIGFRGEKSELDVDAVSAVQGDWRIIFYDDLERLCTGTVYVRPPIAS